jgi:hypothetical protein
MNPARGSFSFTEDFATGGQPDLNDWDTADVTDGQTWILNAEDDTFSGAPFKAAKRDSTSAGGVGNGNTGRLRVLATATEPMQAAIDFTFHLDSGSLDILAVLDGTGNTPFRVRLLDSFGVVAMEFVSANASNSLLRLSQVNAGQFVTDTDNIDWRVTSGANIEIDFDTATDTFTALITDTTSSDQVVLGSTPFDNPVAKIARLELIADVQQTAIGGDLNIERIVLAGEGVPVAGGGGGIPLTETPLTAVTIEVLLTEPELVYRLDSTSDVTDPGSWTSTYTHVQGTGSNIILQAATGTDTHQIYRVVPLSFSPDPPAVSGALLIDQTASIIPGLSDLTAAWGDFDNDGFSDLSDGVRIWRNSGGLSFSFFAEIPGRAWADYNNDGFLDFYGRTDAVGTASIYLSNAGTGFSVQAVPVMPSVISRGGCWGDWDGDTYVEPYLGGYEDLSFIGYPDVRLGNNAGSSFSIEYTEPPAYLNTRGVTACDFDQDGDLDIYVSHYRLQENYLWLNNGAGIFSDVAAAYGVDSSHPFWGHAHTIGSAWGDLDNDGYIDLFVGNFAHPANFFGPGQPRQKESEFLKNLGPAGSYHFSDQSAIAGLAYVESYASPALGDYDNDGDLDLFFTTANVGSKSVLYRNDGNWQFTNVTSESGLGSLEYTYQAAWGDYDNDGDLDLVTQGDFYVNQGNANHWLKVKLDGTSQGVNRSAIGAQARIRLDNRVLTRQVEGGTGEHNQNDLVLHFGLGGHSGPVDLEITWPGGATETIKNLVVDQLVVVD